MVDFDRAINGVTRYINAEVYSRMNGWQEFLARLAVARMIGNTDHLKHSLINNPFVKTLALFDTDGNVDAEGLLDDMRCQMSEKGRITLDIPLFGAFTFTPDDVDKLRRYIMEA